MKTFKKSLAQWQPVRLTCKTVGNKTTSSFITLKGKRFQILSREILTCVVGLDTLINEVTSE